MMMRLSENLPLSQGPYLGRLLCKCSTGIKGLGQSVELGPEAHAWDIPEPLKCTLKRMNLLVCEVGCGSTCL
jgi:hypothetical protein